MVAGAALLTLASNTAAAHGVDIEVAIEGGGLALEFSDETGRTCAVIDGIDTSLFPALVELASVDGDAALLTIEVPDPAREVCELAPVETVNAILADTDTYRATVRSVDGSAIGGGLLRKPSPPGFERVPVASSPVAEAPSETDGAGAPRVDRTRVFVGGALIGVAAAAARRWRRTPRS